MSESNSIYVDHKFFKKSMNELSDDPESCNFPVKVVAFRMGWFLKSDDGLDGRYFLQEVLRNEDLTFYNI